MKTAGIIVEYNPFHNGHLYHIERTRELVGADFVVAVMSGDFVQRGQPALLDKYTRTKMALCCGVDLVLELPVLFSTGSAGDFAAGAVSLLDKLGVTDALCFGSECGQIEPFKQAADVLATEPPAFRSALQRGLKSGLSFPKARELALSEFLTDESNTASLLSQPNNILGLEYCLALKKRNSSICPVTISRKGAGYLEEAFLSDSQTDISTASALAIRKALAAPLQAASEDFAAEASPMLPGAVSPALPDAAFPNVSASLTARSADAVWQLLSPHIPGVLAPLWKDVLADSSFLFANDLTRELRYRLLCDMPCGFLQYADVTRELSDKLTNIRMGFHSWDDLCERLKTRELTYSRISRALCHILLSVTAQETETARQTDYVPYARILGFRKSALPLLSSIKKNSSIPLVSKLADANRQLDDPAREMLQKTILASHIRESALSAKTGKLPCNEYTRQIVVLP